MGTGVYGPLERTEERLHLSTLSPASDPQVLLCAFFGAGFCFSSSWYAEHRPISMIPVIASSVLSRISSLQPLPQELSLPPTLQSAANPKGGGSLGGNQPQRGRRRKDRGSSGWGLSGLYLPLSRPAWKLPLGIHIFAFKHPHLQQPLRNANTLGYTGINFRVWICSPITFSEQGSAEEFWWEEKEIIREKGYFSTSKDPCPTEGLRQQGAIYLRGPRLGHLLSYVFYYYYFKFKYSWYTILY